MFTKIIRYFHNLLGSYLVGGPKGTLQHMYLQITRKSLTVKATNPFTFILNPSHGKIVQSKGSTSKFKTLNWFLMDMGTHGGGDINIFRYINGLSKLGFKSRVYISYFSQHKTREELNKYIRKYYGKVNADFYLPTDKILPADGAVATEWRTAYIVREMTNVKEKFYFIQDYEPYFFPQGSEHELAKNTYTFGFRGITAGTWLKEKINKEFGMKTHAFTFSYDRDIYKEVEEVTRSSKKVFFYARPVTPRRAFELGLLALTELYNLDNNVEIVLAGWDTSNYQIDFPHENLKLLNIKDLPEIYSSCQLGLVLSMTNCSLLPTELLACGCVPVINKGDNNEWLVKDKANCIMINTDPTEIAETIHHYLKHPEKIEQIRKKGRQFVESSSNEEEFKGVAKFIESFI